MSAPAQSKLTCLFQDYRNSLESFSLIQPEFSTKNLAVSVQNLEKQINIPVHDYISSGVLYLLGALGTAGT